MNKKPANCQRRGSTCGESSDDLTRNYYEEEVIEPLSNVPYFSVILLQSHVKSPYSMTIPVKMQAVLPKLQLQAVLNYRGKTWEMEYLWSDHRTRFSTAWKNFVLDNNLTTEDVCLFELTNHDNKTAHFKVQILRGDLPDALQAKIDRAGESSDNPISLE